MHLFHFQIEEVCIESREFFDADGNNNTQETVNKTQNNVDEMYVAGKDKLKDSTSQYEPKWNSYTPAMLKKMRSRKLMTKTPGKKRLVVTQTLSVKSSLVSLLGREKNGSGHLFAPPPQKKFCKVVGTITISLLLLFIFLA